MKYNLQLNKYISSLLIVIIVVFFSCKEDDTVSCTICNSPQTQSFEVCEEDSGNASVNGEDTGVRYDIYIADLIAAGATCGG